MGAPSSINSDTIAAIATPPGRGGIGIIRVSGALVPTIAKAVLGQIPPPRQAEYLPYLDSSSEVMDVGLALYFPAPHSFTGEDVLELQGHGGPVVMDLAPHALVNFQNAPFSIIKWISLRPKLLLI